MKRILIALCAVSSLASAQTPERPNMPVYRSGPWFVVRSVRDGGATIACTGFYRANRRVQLSKDTLIIQAPEEVKSVAFAFDDETLPAQRPLSAAEKELKAIAFTDGDFEKLAASRKVRIEATTAEGMVRHELELTGLSGALDNIRHGCPVPEKPHVAPVRGRHRS